MTDKTGGRTAATDAHDADDDLDLELELAMALPGFDRLAAAGRVASPAPSVVATAQAAVHAAVEREQMSAAAAELDDAPGAAVPVRRRSFRRRWIASAALVAAAATGVAVLPAVSFGDHKPAATADAATFLNGVADRTEAASLHGREPGTAVGRLHGAPYWKVVSEQYLTPNGRAYRQTSYNSIATSESWTYNERMGGPVAGIPDHPRPLTWRVGRTSVGVKGLDELPTDPAALKALLAKAGSVRFTVVEIGTLLSSSPAGPRLRASLFRVLAKLPGIRLDGARKDSMGRAGMQLTFKITDPAFHGEVDTMLVDPRTGTLLKTTMTMPEYPWVDSVDTYLSAGPAWKLPR